jgi:hypothetical protein
MDKSQDNKEEVRTKTFVVSASFVVNNLTKQFVEAKDVSKAVIHDSNAANF